MHYRMNNSNDYGHLRVRSNIVRLRGSQILSRVYLVSTVLFTAPRATTRVSAMLNAKNATLCHSYNPQHTQEVIIRT